MQRDSMNVSDAWAHAIAVTNAMFCTILSRVDDPDPDTHLSHAMHERLTARMDCTRLPLCVMKSSGIVNVLAVGVAGQCDALVRA